MGGAACLVGGAWIGLQGGSSHASRRNETISSLLRNYIAIGIFGGNVRAALLSDLDGDEWTLADR
jgi:ABC-type uncharacterized transport system permease subunit